MPKKSVVDPTAGPVELRKAYLHMIQQPGVWIKLKQGKQTVMNRRVSVKRGMYPKDTVMRVQLARMGWRKVIEEQWEFSKAATTGGARKGARAGKGAGRRGSR